MIDWSSTWVLNSDVSEITTFRELPLDFTSFIRSKALFFLNFIIRQLHRLLLKYEIDSLNSSYSDVFLLNLTFDLEIYWRWKCYLAFASVRFCQFSKRIMDGGERSIVRNDRNMWYNDKMAYQYGRQPSKAQSIRWWKGEFGALHALPGFISSGSSLPWDEGKFWGLGGYFMPLRSALNLRPVAFRFVHAVFHKG